MRMKNNLPEFRATGLSAPELLTIAITNRCNLHCPHCWVDATLKPEHEDVRLEKLGHIVREFADLGGRGVRLSGGEPLLHPDINESLRLIAATGLDAHLQTNGTVLNASHIDTFKRVEDLTSLTLQVSLDGATASTHDQIRGAGSFAETMHNIKRLINAGLGKSLRLFFTEMRHNIEELPALLSLADQLGITSVATGTVVLCGRAKIQPKVMPATAQQYSQLIHHYVHDKPFRTRYNRIGSTAVLEWYKNGLSPTPCDFVKNPYLSSTGVLYPCLMCHIEAYSVAEVFQKGLRRALHEGTPKWLQLRAIRSNKASLAKTCQTCALFEQCAGGCLGRAWGRSRTLGAAEDRCEQRKIVVKWRKNTPDS